MKPKGLDHSNEMPFLEQLVHDTLADKKFRKFRKIVRAVDAAFHTTLEDLFKVVPYYESLILAEARSGSLLVASPENGADCGNSIAFELKQPSASPLKLTIENSNEDILIKTQIDANSQTFKIDLNPSQRFPTGRYYWKLKSDDGTLIREFFINKDLMPSKYKN